jgi:hypothetical protein
MYRLFDVGFCSFGIIGLGLAIRIYVLGEDVQMRGKPKYFDRVTHGEMPDKSD